MSGNSTELNKIQTLSENSIDTDTDVKFHLKGGFRSKSLNSSDLVHTTLGYWILDSVVQTLNMKYVLILHIVYCIIYNTMYGIIQYNIISKHAVWLEFRGGPKVL